MKYLLELTPAENLLVLRGADAKLKELLKGTFVDLLLKQVIQVSATQHQAIQAESARTLHYVEAGANFGAYQPLPHEGVFLDTFRKSPGVRILFANLVNLAYQGAKHGSRHRALITKNPGVRACFKASFLQSIFGGFSLSPEGAGVKRAVEKEISELEFQLANATVDKQRQADKVAEIVKGNIFLLQNADLNLLQIAGLSLPFTRREATADYPDVFATGFEGFMDGFDSGGGHSGDGHHGGGGDGSGCGGDSGSGCSGCGGGGGCGGGD